MKNNVLRDICIKVELIDNDVREIKLGIERIIALLEQAEAPEKSADVPAIADKRQTLHIPIPEPETGVRKKRCPNCGQAKPESEFYRDRSKRDGLCSWCRECKDDAKKKRIAAAPMKTCPRCGESKPATTEYFGKRTKARDGLQAWCRTCYREYRKLQAQKRAIARQISEFFGKEAQ